jgi:hypothetical protein
MNHQVKNGFGFLLACELLGLLGGAFAAAESKKSKTKPVELTEITQLKEAFKRDAEFVRLILLLSPT